MLQTAFRQSCMNRASVSEWHKRFKEGRESVRDDERCGRSKEVNTPDLIGKRVRVRVTMLRLEMSLERDSLGRGQHFSNRSVAFPPGQCINPQPHPFHRLFDQDGHPDSSLPPTIVQTLLPVTFGYSLSLDAVVMRQLRR